MKNLKNLLSSLCLLFAFFVVSCSQDENVLVTEAASTTVRMNRAAASVVPHGKLEIINNTDFEMYGPLICFGSDNFNIDTNLVLRQYITIPPGATVVLTDFQSAFQQGLTSVDEWSVEENSTMLPSISGAVASGTYGLFQNNSDPTNGFYGTWAFFGKDGYMKGYVTDPVLASQIGNTNNTRYVNYTNGFVLNENFGAGGILGGAWGDVTIDLVPFNFLPNLFGQTPIIIIQSSVNILANGDTKLKISQGNGVSYN